MPSPLLLLQDISLTFGVTPLLYGAALSVAGGARICLVCHNSSSKSTLPRIAAGLVQPDGGERFAQPGATISYLPQEPDLTGFGTTLAYVEAGFGAEADDHHRALYLLKALGLSGEEEPAALSGGEARRAPAAWGGVRAWPAMLPSITVSRSGRPRESGGNAASNGKAPRVSRAGRLPIWRI